MADGFKEFQKTFEIFTNSQAAELEAVRHVLQSLVVALLPQSPQGAEAFSNLRSESLRRLADDTNRPHYDQDQRRKAELVLQRATEIFDEMAPAYGLPPADSGGPKH